MSSAQSYPKLYEELFRTTSVPHLGLSLVSRSDVTAAHLQYDSLVGLGKTFPYTLESSYLVQFQMRQIKLSGQWCNGRIVPTDPYLENTLTIYDMREEWRTEMNDPFEVLHLHIPQLCLDRLADAHNAPRITGLNSPPASGHVDPMMRHFVDLLVPAIDGTQRTSGFYVEHMLLALHEYIAMTYGGLQPQPRTLQGALAPWRQRRAIEFMRANMTREISLEDVAQHCDMSVSHFLRAFRKSTGETPHRWLMKERAGLSIELLKQPELTLSTIATACGFADQSHFTRVFAAVYGVTPGNWRRAAGPRKSGR